MADRERDGYVLTTEKDPVGVDRLVLATSSAHGVYRRVGFTIPAEGRYMELDNRGTTRRTPVGQ
jgi:hypothetical protein